MVGAALDSAAGLIALVSMLHFQGRDGVLAELVGDDLDSNLSCGRNPTRTTLGSVKIKIDTGHGVAERTLLNITKARRQLIAKAEGKDDGKVKGLAIEAPLSPRA